MHWDTENMLSFKQSRSIGFAWIAFSRPCNRLRLDKYSFRLGRFLVYTLFVKGPKTKNQQHNNNNNNEQKQIHNTECP